MTEESSTGKIASEKSKDKSSEMSGSMASSPYSLYASDNPGSVICSVILKGDNYNEWSIEMVNALRAKRKIGFIDVSLQKPPTGSDDLELWLSANSMIVGWIRSSIDPKVRSTVSFITEAYKLWENLKKRFSVGNKVRIHFLKAQLASCRQDGQTVMDYDGRLSTIWEELETYKFLPTCSCGAAREFEKEREEEKIHQFVMGLDESRLGGVCTGIVDMDPLPDLSEVYAKVIREEQRLASSKEREQQKNMVGFVAKQEPVTGKIRFAAKGKMMCTHCSRTGHEKSSCWQLVGFPDWWTERQDTTQTVGGGRGANRGGRGANRGGHG